MPDVLPAMHKTSTRPALAAMAPWIALAIAVAVLDQASKQWVLNSLHHGQVIPVTGFFDLVLVFNPGAAFSFLADHDGWQRWFFTGLATVIWRLVAGADLAAPRREAVADRLRPDHRRCRRQRV